MYGGGRYTEVRRRSALPSTAERAAWTTGRRARRTCACGQCRLRGARQRPCRGTDDRARGQVDQARSSAVNVTRETTAATRIKARDRRPPTATHRPRPGEAGWPPCLLHSLQRTHRLHLTAVIYPEIRTTNGKRLPFQRSTTSNLSPQGDSYIIHTAL